MSARAERAVAVQKPKNRTVVVNFVPEQLKAPFLLRCGALIIDYIIIVAAPVLGILAKRYLGADIAKIFDSEQWGWLIGFLFALTNLVIFPALSGQSIGKTLTGLRIVKRDGNTISFSRILMRQLVGYPLTVLTLGLGFIFSGFNRKGRALHDYLAGTVVIYGRRRVLKKESNL